MLNRHAVGWIAGAFGIKGYVKLRLPVQHEQRFQRLRRVYVGLTAEEATAATIEDVIIRNRQVLVKLSAIRNRTEAEARRGETIFADGDNLESPPPGSYYIHDLVGCSVNTPEGEILGVLDDVLHSAGGDLWSVRRGEKSVLIPAVKEFIREVRIAERVIIVRTIEGLIESQE